MIQYIALALAIDAECQAANANRKADEANHSARGSGASLVIIRPVDLEMVKTRETKGFWDALMCPMKNVLKKEPWATLSIKKSDILSLREYQDGNGEKYISIRISQYAEIWRGEDHIIGLKIPGSIEEVTKIIGGL